VKYPPCEYCGIDQHGPWEDGLLECRSRLVEQCDCARAEERAAIVAWLLKQEGPETYRDLADCIAQGEHRT